MSSECQLLLFIAFLLCVSLSLCARIFSGIRSVACRWAPRRPHRGDRERTDSSTDWRNLPINGYDRMVGTCENNQWHD